MERTAGPCGYHRMGDDWGTWSGWGTIGGRGQANTDTHIGLHLVSRTSVQLNPIGFHTCLGYIYLHVPQYGKTTLLQLHVKSNQFMNTNACVELFTNEHTR